MVLTVRRAEGHVQDARCPADVQQYVAPVMATSPARDKGECDSDRTSRAVVLARRLMPTQAAPVFQRQARNDVVDYARVEDAAVVVLEVVASRPTHSAEGKNTAR